VGTLSRKGDLLHGSTDGTQDDCQVERARLPPLVSNFIPDRFCLGIVETLNRFKSSRVFGNKSPLAQEVSDIGEAMVLGEFLNIDQQLIVCEAR